MEKLKVEYVPIGSVKEYENNAKKHPVEQIQQIKESIKLFGDCDPIGIWHDTIVEGHGRYRALLEMGETEVPVIRLDHLTDEQRKAYALVHNKLTMNSDFDEDTLLAELDKASMDLSTFGFEDLQKEADWFSNRERFDNSGEYGEEYDEFTQKFEQKRTTDDCYTPDEIYDAVADWVAEEYGVKRKDMKRPFYPGGDYKKEKYRKSDVVVDNPPFSILAEIIQFYSDKEIPFFLFAPALTLFSSSSSSSATAITVGCSVTYENGANVNTSFVTNLGDRDLRFTTAPELYKRVKEANDNVLKGMRKTIPKYSYPDHVVTSAICNKYSKYGIQFSAKRSETYKIGELDEQKEQGKSIFGNGYLVSDHVAKERAAAERAAAERAAAERAAAERWTLSDRELTIIKGLNGA